MTRDEQNAMNEVRAILIPYFDSFVITTRTADGNGDRINSEWHGSLSDVLGLASITKMRLEKIANDQSGAPDIR